MQRGFWALATNLGKVTVAPAKDTQSFIPVRFAGPHLVLTPLAVCELGWHFLVPSGVMFLTSLVQWHYTVHVAMRQP